MNKMNKNNLILAISACLIVFAVILVSVASIVENKKEGKAETTTPQQVVENEKTPENAPQNKPADTTAAPATKPAANGKFTTGKYKIATEKDPLTLREYPGEGRVGEIPKGETVEVIAVHDEWGYVLYDGENGWISLTLAELVSATEPTTTNKPGKYKINTQDDPLGIRSQITDGDRIGEIPKGSTVDILAVCNGTEGEYGLVNYEGSFGWLPFKYLKAA